MGRGHLWHLDGLGALLVSVPSPLSPTAGSDVVAQAAGDNAHQYGYDTV